MLQCYVYFSTLTDSREENEKKLMFEILKHKISIWAEGVTEEEGVTMLCLLAAGLTDRQNAAAERA